jgi:peptide/nickel transport system substrate-binding protein
MRRISRRTFLAGAAGAAGLAVLRCGGDEETAPTDTTPTVGAPKRGGVLHLGSTFPALSLDPHGDVTLGLAFAPYVYGYLLHEIYHLKGPPTLLFDHAETLEQPDELTYVFKLHPGIRFQDLPPANGRELTADDVLYSFDRIASLTTGATPFWKTGIASKSAPDPYTVEVRLNSPYAYTMAEFGGQRTAIVPKEAVEQWGDLKSQSLGSGPFQVETASRGETMDMVRNPNYYREGIPYLDGMGWRIIPDDSSLRAAFRAQQLDVYGAPTKLQADDVASASDDVVVTTHPSLTIFQYFMNELSQPALQDVRVREALDISIDRDAMIDKLAFGEGKVCGPVSWGLEFWSLPQEELRERYKRDVAKARQLLEAAGASDLTLSIKFYPGSPSDLAAMIKDQMAEAGVTINLVPVETGTWYADRGSLNYELMCREQIPYPSEQYVLQFFHTRNWTRDSAPQHLPEPELDALLDKILATPDINERQKLVFEATRMTLDRHGPFVSCFAPYAYTASWNYVKGYAEVEPTMANFTYDMWLDK